MDNETARLAVTVDFPTPPFPDDIATILDEDGVAIRAGHHCCQILHDKLNIPASARASVGIYNTRDDLEKLNDSINNCKKIFDLK